MENMRDVICLCLEHEDSGIEVIPDFVGVQRIVV